MWAPGMLAVCVNNQPHEKWLRRGMVYTVAAVEFDEGKCFLGLSEVPMPTSNYSAQWLAKRFRPVSPVHKQIIRDLLVPVPDPDLIVEEGIDAVLRERLGAG